MRYTVWFVLSALLLALAGCGGDSNSDSPPDTSTPPSDIPSVSVNDARINEGDSGVVRLSFTVSLSAISGEGIDISYGTVDGTAKAGSDYTGAAVAQATIAAGDLSTTIDIDINGDTRWEKNETFTLVLTDVSVNAELGAATEGTGTIVNDDMGVLNDTGITFGGNAGAGNNAGCSGAVAAAQDCSQGRDMAGDDDDAGFSFSKLDASGSPLADQNQNYVTTPWLCVRDEVTGLIWEVKAHDGGLRDRDWAYTYYDSSYVDSDGSDDKFNGGTDRVWAGPEDTGGGSGFDDCGNTDFICTTEQYVADVNAAGLCGFGDWRLPTRAELDSIVNYNRAGAGAVLDPAYFPNIREDGYEWTSSPRFSPVAEPVVNKRWILLNTAAGFYPETLDDTTTRQTGIRLVRD